MNDILMTNVFFTITGVAVIVLTILLSILFYKAILLVRSLHSFLEYVRGEGESLVLEVKSIGKDFNDKKDFLLSLFSFFKKEKKKVARNKKTTV